jgi:hypothetical protein
MLYIAIQVTGTNTSFRLRPGNYLAHTFVDGDVTVGTDTINDASHGLETKDGPYRLSNSGGALPTGLSTTQDYYIIKVDDDNYKFAESALLAGRGTAVDITAAAGGGTHSWSNTAFAVAATTEQSVGQESFAIGSYNPSIPPSYFSTTFACPEQLTVEGASADAVLTYWFLP